MTHKTEKYTVFALEGNNALRKHLFKVRGDKSCLKGMPLQPVKSIYYLYMLSLYTVGSDCGQVFKHVLM